jgi:hypothetical protein
MFFEKLSRRYAIGSVAGYTPQKDSNTSPIVLPLRKRPEMSIASVSSGSITVKFLLEFVLEKSIVVYRGGVVAAVNLAPYFLRSRSSSSRRITFTICAADKTSQEALRVPNWSRSRSKAEKPFKAPLLGPLVYFDSVPQTDKSLSIYAHVTLQDPESS